MDSKEPHTLLGLSPDASLYEIKQAYRRLALKWHPDRRREDEDREYAKNVFAEITTAYQTLLSESELPLTSTAASKLRTRLPTPVPSHKSLSEDSRTNTSNSDYHFFTPYNSNRESSQATLPSSFNDSLKDTDYNGRHGKYMHASMPMVHNHVSPEAADYRSPREHWKPAKHLVHSKHPSSSPPLTVRQTGENIYARGRKINLSPSATVIAVTDGGYPKQSSELLKRGPPLELLGAGGSGEWSYSLTLSLEDLFTGKRCQFCIVRRLLSGRLKDIIIEIDIPPGCRAGARILCRGVGHELHNGILQDVAFVIAEADHPRFLRSEDNLHLDIKLPWADNLMQRPEHVNIVGVDGEEIIVAVDYMQHRMTKGDFYVWGSGMPIREGNKVIGRGNLIVQYV
ncbi:hypothetical protein H0H92_005215 [Tricholoma furcatifolium]|nr:hypothetical protein H0H92_005215 [Tricholoma furcatifolium]